MNKLFLAVLVFTAVFSQAQSVFWADEIGEFSSQRGEQEFSAEQVLGEPNAYPNGGESPVSWCSSKADGKKEEFIRVKFKNTIQVQQVVVAENNNAGAIAKVSVFSTGGQEHTVYEAAPKKSPKNTRLLNIILPQPTNYKVRQVKVYLRPNAVSGYNCIDAIGISESKVPISIGIKLAKNGSFEEKPKNLGSKINSTAHDFMPQISPDGERLYFTRRGHAENLGPEKADDIWYAEKTSGGWDASVKMPPPINNENYNYACNITPDGNTLLLGNSYGEYGSVLGVAISAKEKNGWSDPKVAEIEDLHSESTLNEFFLAANKKVLLMTLDRPEGRGSNDMYVSFLGADNKWSKPKNMGKVVNTAGIEMSPFLAADNKTLYFSSSGHSGYGGQDLFVSTRLDDSWTKWTAPTNLGDVINTPEDENYYSIPASGEYAYFVSKKNTLGNSDIFRIKLPEAVKPQPVALIYGNVYNEDTKKPMAADIFYEIFPQGLEAGFASSNPETGEYKIVLPLGEEYGFYADKYGFLSVNDNIDLREIKDEYVEIKRDLYLAPIKEGQKIVMNSLLFYQSKYEMLPSSFPELKRLVKILKQRRTMIVKLHGHTDNRGNYEANLKLSKERVRVVKEYLMENGITPDRIEIEGHGGKEPLVANDTEEHRRRNRRVEFEIIRK